LPNECIQSLLRFFDGQSGLEPSHCAGNKSETSNRRDRKRQSNESCGCPNFHITAKTFTGMTKIRRHHPDDGVAILVQANSFADHVWIAAEDRKSTRLNSSHITISYAVFCLKKKIKKPIKESNNIK